MRDIPDDNLAYPVLITLKTGSFGSGFFINTENETYLITAGHVLFSEVSRDLLSTEANLLCYSKDPNETGANRFHLDLASLARAGHARMHATRDVAVVLLGIREPEEKDGRRPMTFVHGVTLANATPLGIIGVAYSSSIKRYAEVLVANDVIVFGYPNSLGLKSIPQLDSSRPLLRKGIVAGLNPVLRSIVLDCPVYPGNSGGPVLEAETEGLGGRRFRVIGVVSQFVPHAEVWVNTTHSHTNTSISNSGYSMATPMDFVLELIAPP